MVPMARVWQTVRSPPQTVVRCEPFPPRRLSGQGQGAVRSERPGASVWGQGDVTRGERRIVVRLYFSRNS